MNFNPALMQEGAQISAIECFADGGFAMTVTTPNGKHGLWVYDTQGRLGCKAEIDNPSLANFYRGAYLEGDRCLLLTPNDTVNSEISVVGAMLTAQGLAYKTGIDDFKIFANGWYWLSILGVKKLFNAEHMLVAENFTDACVFNIGYALKDEQIAKDSWQLFSLTGTLIKTVAHVVDFVGDGNILVADEDSMMRLLSFDGKVLVCKPIACYEKFNNGRFVLNFTDQTMRMMEADGTSLSVLVQDASFLPDGSMVHFDGKLIGGVYRSDGILDRREIYSYEKAGNYYLFTGEFDSGLLYNDEGQKLGKDYVLLRQKENFCLFEHDNVLELFNQFGKIAVFSNK